TVRNGLSGSGGGIRVGNADLVVQDSVVTGNRASGNGGGIANDPSSGATNVTLVRSTVDHNVSGGFGGGLYVVNNIVDQRSVLNVSASAILRNNSIEGGGIDAFQANLTNSTVSGNTAQGVGGGITATSIELLRRIALALTLSTLRW